MSTDQPTLSTRLRLGLAWRLDRWHRRLARPWQGPARTSEDPAAAVPFNYDLGGIAAPARGIAVVCHLFYAELATEHRALLGRIPFPADLFFSTDTEAKRTLIAEAFSDWPNGRVEVRLSPNRGRDVLPKLVTFADIYAGYELVLFLHGKKSLTFGGGDDWRTLLHETLVGSPDVVRSIVTLFDRFPDIGIVAPQHYEAIRGFIHWDENFRYAQPLARRMGVRLSRREPIDFAAGSMFWARTAALRPLLDLNLTPDDFPPESGQVRRTIQHAIERLVFVAADRAGYGWVKIAAPACYPADDPITTIASPAALNAFVAASGENRNPRRKKITAR